MDLIADVNFSAIMPELILAIGAMVVLMVEVFLPRDRGEVGAVISLIAFAGATLACFPLARKLIIFSGTYIIDLYSFFFKVVLFAIADLVTGYFGKDLTINSGIYDSFVWIVLGSFGIDGIGKFAGKKDDNTSEKDPIN